MWLAFEACKCRESCTVYVCAGAKKRNIPLDIWLYIRVFLYYILYNFYKRVFEFMCMTKKGVMVFLFFFRKTAFSAFTNIQLRCLIAWSKKTQLVITFINRLFVRDTGTLFIANKTKHLIALECFFLLTNAANHGLTETKFTLVIVWRKSFDVNYLGTSDVSRWDICWRSVKALFTLTS